MFDLGYRGEFVLFLVILSLGIGATFGSWYSNDKNISNLLERGLVEYCATNGKLAYKDECKL